MMIAMDRSAPETGAALQSMLTGPAAMRTAPMFAPWTLLTANHTVSNIKCLMIWLQEESLFVELIMIDSIEKA